MTGFSFRTRVMAAGPALATMAILVTACASSGRVPRDYPGPRPFPAESVLTYCHDRRAMTDEFELLTDADDYRVYAVTLRIAGDAEDDPPITFEFYEQKSGEAVPVAILLPILNGQKNVMRPFANHFVGHGYAVIIVDTTQRKTLLEDIVEPEPAILKTIERHRRVIDWAESRRDLDTSRLGVFGASLGGFNALFLTAVDNRVGVLSIALVGGSLADVLMASDERRIVRAVEEAEHRLGMTDAELRAYLTERIATEPLTLAPYLDANRVLMVLARFDNAVPFERQAALHEAMGRPRAITLPTGHGSAALYLFYLRARVREFFDEALRHPGVPVSTVPLPDACRQGPQVSWRAVPAGAYTDAGCGKARPDL
ncbi:MAG: hypothetical protein P8172_15265 [Gammaproteobacteria bacterium]